jgi:hypothetical protein
VTWGAARRCAGCVFKGDDIPFVPNKRTGGVCIGSKIAPIFFNTMEDSGSLPIEMPVENMAMGDMIDIYPYEGVTKRHGTDEVICNFELKTQVMTPLPHYAYAPRIAHLSPRPLCLRALTNGGWWAVAGAAGRGSRGRAHPADRWARADGQGAHVVGAGQERRLPQAGGTRCQHTRLHFGAEDGGQGVRRGGHSAGHLLRA